MRKFASTLVVVLGAAVAVAATPAQAAVTCSYWAAAGEVTVTMSANDDLVIIARQPAGDRILVNGSTCVEPGSGATASIYDDIVNVDGSAGAQSAVIDLSNGMFEYVDPFFGGTHEMRFDVDLGTGADVFALQDSSARANNVVLGGTGINFDADDEVDAPVSGVERGVVSTFAGNDQVHSAGGSGNPGDWTAYLELYGGDGGDYLLGGGGGTYFVGGPGVDTLAGRAASSDAAGYDGAPAAVTVDLSSGWASGGADTDQLVSIENAIGSVYADLLIGNDGPNTLRGNLGLDELRGGPGDDFLFGGGDGDVLKGGAGNDAFSGGAGADTVDFQNALAGVSVDLAAGTASGQGSDTLAEIENVTGSFYNDTLVGSGLANVLRGNLGADVVRGALGPDQVFGGGDNDQVFGGGDDDYVSGGNGDDALDGGAGSGDFCDQGLGVGTSVNCELP